MTREQIREYKNRAEDFKRQLTELLVDYNVHIYVEDHEGMYINTSILGLYCHGEFDVDYEQPTKEK